MILPISSIQTETLNNKKKAFTNIVQKRDYNQFSGSRAQIAFKGRLFSTHYFIVPYSEAETQARENQTQIDKQIRGEAIETRRNNLRAQAIEEAKKNKALLDSISSTKGIDELRNQIQAKFSEKVKMERQGLYNGGIPNCIMIEDPYNDVSKKLVVITAKSSECNFVDLNDEDKNSLLDHLWETLQKSKSHFKSTKERTLIYVKDFDQLITKGLNSSENIESLKDIMCRCAGDFGSTIIFRTKDASKLVSEATQPQRVAVKVIVNFKSVK